MPPVGFFQELADFFGALARIFGDPEVQASGERFIKALDDAGAKELPEGITIRGAIDVPSRVKGVDPE